MGLDANFVPPFAKVKLAMDGTQHKSGRISLANLNEPDYANIGRTIRIRTSVFYAQFLAAKNTKKGAIVKAVTAKSKTTKKSKK